MKKKSASESAFFNPRILLGFVLCSIAIFLALVGLIVFLRIRRRWISRRTILEVDFERGVVETVPDDVLGRLAKRRSLVLRDVIVHNTVTASSLGVTSLSLLLTGAVCFYAALRLFTREALLVRS